MRILRLVVSPEDEGRAVRAVVPRRFSLGTHAYRRLKAQGGILVDGVPAHADLVLRAGQVVEICLPSAEDARGDAPAAAPPGLPPSFLRYRDDDLLIVSKGAPLATLPGIHNRTGTLREQVAAMLGVDAAAFVYHPVNRLDKGTSGLLAIALNAHAQRLLSRELHTGAFVREYLAVVEGVPEDAAGVIDAPIARLGQGARRCIRADGQRAVTHYAVERVSGGRALLRLRLETGRTHQIRVHLSSIGCPIAGDYLYGSELPELDGRFALHSAALALTQPVTGARVEVEEPLPDALAALMR